MDEIMDNINLNFKFENGIQETEMTANILQEMGIPYLLTCLLRHLYAGQELLEPDMEQQTASILGKEYVKAVYCHPAYLLICRVQHEKTLGTMKHKLESRLPGEISVTSDMQMTPPLWQKARGTPDESKRGE